MKLSIKDLELLLEYIKRRSTDVSVRVNMHSGDLEVSFHDVDGNHIVAIIKDAETSMRARIMQQDYLDVAVKSLKK